MGAHKVKDYEKNGAGKDRTARKTLRGATDKLTGKGLDHDEREVNRLAAAEQHLKTDERYVYLGYDIPTALNAECPNPSAMLWSFGFRLQLSGFVLPERVAGFLNPETRHPQLKELMEHWDTCALTDDSGNVVMDEEGNPIRVTYDMILYDASMMDTIRALCFNRLQSYVMSCHRRLIENIANASDLLESTRKELDEKVKAGDQSVSAEEYEKALKKFRMNCYSHIKKATEALASTIDCAERFDQTEDFMDLFCGLRKAIIAQKALADAKAEMAAV